MEISTKPWGDLTSHGSDIVPAAEQQHRASMLLAIKQRDPKAMEWARCHSLLHWCNETRIFIGKAKPDCPACVRRVLKRGFVLSPVLS